MPDTAFQLLHLCHSISNRHTLTLLCANLSLLISVRKHARVPTIPVDTPVLSTLQENDVGTPTPRSQEHEVSSLSPETYVRSFASQKQLEKEYIFFCTVLHIPVKVYNIDLKQTGSSFKNVSNHYSQFLHPNLFHCRWRKGPILPRTGQVRKCTTSRWTRRVCFSSHLDFESLHSEC